MKPQGTFFHSPFSETNVCLPVARSLLVQFILSEFFLACTKETAPEEKTFSSPLTMYFPYNWAFPKRPLSKIEEHLKLLSCAFAQEGPKLSLLYAAFHKAKEGSFKEFLLCLIPFLARSKESAHMLLVLLRNRTVIASLMDEKHFFSAIYPEGVHLAGRTLCNCFERRDFEAQASEMSALLTSFEGSLCY